MDIKIKELLLPLAENDYKSFSERLLPDGIDVLGVRLPALRSIAKELAKTDPELSVFQQSDTNVLEELLLEGMAIGYIKCDDEHRCLLLKRFIPRINCWSVCDSSCATYKFMEKNRELYWKYVTGYAFSEKEYEIRFCVVSVLFHFVCDEYIDRVLDLLKSTDFDAYYVKMAVAWGLCDCYIKYPEKTLKLFEEKSLDVFIQNKSISKCCDSYRVSEQDKLMLKSLRK